MATVGQQLTTPESGWRRYDDTHAALKYTGSWYTATSTSYYNGSVRVTSKATDNNYITFTFYGTKLRLIADLYQDRHSDNNITIDGVSETFSEYPSGSTSLTQAIVYEKTGLPLAFHTVSVTVGHNRINFILDAIDIDSTGRLYHPSEVTDMADIKVGKRIRCHYSSPASGVGGSFSNLGKESSDFIPATSSAIPNGDFYFIATESVNQKIILVADRNVQHTISWDTLNNTGIASGTGRPILYDITSSLVNYFPMDEPDGGTIFDVIGSSNGIANGTTIISGWNGTGYARSFNGTSDYIRFSSNPLIPTGKKSIRLKIRIPSIPSSVGYVLSNVDNSVAQHGITMSISTEGKLRIFGTNATSGFRYDLISPTSICDNAWHDILFTWDGTTSQNGVKLYVDDMGNPVSQATSSSIEPTTYYAAGTTFGRLGGTATVFYLRCDLDSVEIYNDVINANNNAPELVNSKWDIRLLTGGTSSTDTDNEWNKYIVNSTLNGTIIAGDNNVWNWGVNTVASMTSTTVSGTSANRVARGYALVNGFYNGLSSYVGATYGFRPVLVIEDLFKYDKTEFITQITIPFRNDISSSIYVYRDEYFDGTTSITQRKSYLNVPYRNNFTASITVRPNGFMKGNVVVTPVSWVYLNTSIQVKLPSNIFSYISIKPHNKMTGTVEIFQPPITTVDLFPVQDAFVRSLVPKLNYGIEQEMLVGVNPDTGEYYKSLLKFDISCIPPGQKIKSAIVKVYYDDINDLPVNLLMSEALGTWTETGVTWANTPAIGDITCTIQTPDQNGYISIDVKDNISDWYNGLKINNGWIIDAENATETYKLYTKERAVNKPFITIEYFDPVAKSVGIVDIPVTITVAQNKTKDITGRLTVTSSYRTEDFTSHLHVLNQDMLESFITVNKVVMPGTITVRRNDLMDIPSNISVRRREIFDFECNVKISRPVIFSSMTVRGNGTAPLSTSITVRKSIFNNLSSKISVGRPWLDTSISVVTSNYFNSYITVNRNDQKNLSSTITVRRSETSDIVSKTDIWIPSLLPSEIFVISGFLHSSITVPYRDYKNLSSRITVREKFASDLMSHIGIYRLDSISASISIVQNGGNSGFVIII